MFPPLICSAQHLAFERRHAEALLSGCPVVRFADPKEPERTEIDTPTEAGASNPAPRLQKP